MCLGQSRATAGDGSRRRLEQRSTWRLRRGGGGGGPGGGCYRRCSCGLSRCNRNIAVIVISVRLRAGSSSYQILLSSHPLILSSSHPLILSSSHPLILPSSHPLILSSSHPLILPSPSHLRLFTKEDSFCYQKTLLNLDFQVIAPTGSWVASCIDPVSGHGR